MMVKINSVILLILIWIRIHQILCIRIRSQSMRINYTGVIVPGRVVWAGYAGWSVREHQGPGGAEATSLQDDDAVDSVSGTWK